MEFFCTCCTEKIPYGELCEECIEVYGNEDMCPDRYCNSCGQDLLCFGGICDNCDSEEDV